MPPAARRVDVMHLKVGARLLLRRPRLRNQASKLQIIGKVGEGVGQMLKNYYGSYLVVGEHQHLILALMAGSREQASL